jgi:hypothetical protein
LWASVANVKGYLASFKKFFTWMGETGLVSPQIVADVLDTLKFDRTNTSERLLSNYHHSLVWALERVASYPTNRLASDS